MNPILLLQTLPTTAALPTPDVSYKILLPEIIVTFAAIVAMLVDGFNRREDQRWLTGGISLVGLIGAAVACVWMWSPGTAATGGRAEAWNGMIVLDTLRLSFTLVFLFVSAVTVLVSMIWMERERLPAGEFHSLLLFATLGMMLMASGGDLVIIFLGLEILSIATYVMAGFRRTDLRSNESALKYFILGSFSSAFLLYGIALVYGATATVTAGGEIIAGTTNINEIAGRLPDALYPSLLFAGAAMMIIGFGFKIATAPFHVWTPDVYEGAPTPVTAWMAAGPKAAGFAAFMRMFVFGFPFIAAATTVGGAESNTAAALHSAWINALAVLAVLTMTLGNVVAVVQTNVKRMLAYSSIAHAGYALIGFVAAGVAQDEAQRQAAIGAVVFYMLTYAVMNLGAFAVVQLIARGGDTRTDYEDYIGIGFRAPVLAFALSLMLLSLLGAPLTAGFMGKVVVFQAALQQAPIYRGLYILVVVGVLNTAISIYYYLGLIVQMFFRERASEWRAPVVTPAFGLALVIAIAGVLLLGIFPNSVINLFQATQPAVSSLVAP